MRPLPITTLTCTAPDGVLRFRLADLCLGRVEGWRDGVRLPATLDPVTDAVRHLRR